MKNEWEYAIKPQYRADDTTKKEYIVAIPAEAFKGASMNDDSRKPIIKEGRIYFSRYVINLYFNLAGTYLLTLLRLAPTSKKLLPRYSPTLRSW